MIRTVTIQDVARRLYVTVPQAREHLAKCGVRANTEGYYQRRVVDEIIAGEPLVEAADTELAKRGAKDIREIRPGGKLKGLVTLRQIAERLGYAPGPNGAQSVKFRLRRAGIEPIHAGARGKPALYNGSRVELWWKLLPESKKKITSRSSNPEDERANGSALLADSIKRLEETLRVVREARDASPPNLPGRDDEVTRIETSLTLLRQSLERPS